MTNATQISETRLALREAEFDLLGILRETGNAGAIALTDMMADLARIQAALVVTL